MPRPFISVGPTNTTAEVGDSIELPCRAQLSSQGIDDDSATIPRYTEDQAKIRYYWFHYGVKNQSDDEQNGDNQDGGHSESANEDNGDVNNEDLNNDESDAGDMQNGAANTQNGDVINDGDENRDVINSGPDMASGRLTMTENGTLRINGVQMHDRGQFVCVASNAGGNAVAAAYMEVIGGFCFLSSNCIPRSLYVRFIIPFCTCTYLLTIVNGLVSICSGYTHS